MTKNSVLHDLQKIFTTAKKIHDKQNAVLTKKKFARPKIVLNLGN
jgi:hypothetical protein